MNGWFRQYSYSVIKMFVNQFAISIFGLVLAMATAATKNNALTIFVSIFSIVFYLFLIDTMTWEIGAKDRISVDCGKKKYRPHTGLLLSLLANLPNLILAVLFTVAYPFMQTEGWAANMSAIVMTISAIVEGMYRGITAAITLPDGKMLLHCWWSYFLIIVPALITAWFSYFMGFKNKRFVAGYFDKNQKKKQ